MVSTKLFPLGLYVNAATLSLSYIGRAAAQLSISPAAITVSRDTGAAAPLFDAETVQLDHNAIQRINADDDSIDYDQLFGFGDKQSTLSMRTTQSCKYMPGDRSWPSDRFWFALSYMLRGALIPTVPIAAPCYNDWGQYSSEGCAAIQGNFSSTAFHEADPTSVMWPIFQGRSCLPGDNPDGSCQLGGYPSYVVNVTNVAQMQLAVNFARNMNIRLVIKNTGHCYLGKSSGAGSLSVWTHHLRDIKYMPDFKNAEYSGPALKVGAGVTVREVYLAAREHGMMALGGTCPNVGFAGGYLAGGGHNPLSGLYGMAADQVVAFEVVTADGKYVTASTTKNADLYWALRGGGGSTFGIVTSAIVRVYPSIPITTTRFTISSSDTVSPDTFWEGVRPYFERFIPFTDAGIFSYFFISKTNGTLSLQMIPFFAPNHTIESSNALLKPWFDRMTELEIPFTPNVTHYDNFYDAYDNNFFDDNPIGSVTVMPGNRLLPRSNWEDEDKFEATFASVKEVAENGYLIVGYNQAPRNRINVDNAVNSAWRDAVSMLISNVGLPENATPADLKAGSEKLLHEALGPWRNAAPNSEGGGAYGNEAHPAEPDWQSAFYGSHYPRLLDIKRKWDPQGVFYATTGVGSEFWEIQDGNQGVPTQNGRLCRV